MKKNKIYTLGICNDNTASACLFIDGSLVSAISEERLTRKKYDKSFPIKSINYILKENNIKLNRINNIAYSWSKDFNPDLTEKYKKRFAYLKKRSQKELKIFSDRYKYDFLRDKKNKNQFSLWCKKSLTKKQLKNVNIYYHHEAHAASACLLSNFNKGLVLTADGRGDFEALTLSFFNRYQSKPLKKIYSSTSSDSLGYFYGRITGLLGFKPMEHEGKITGLAAHGKHNKAMPLMKKMVNVIKGDLIASLGEFYKPFFKPYSRVLRKEISKFSPADVASAAQKHLEECCCKILVFYLKKFKLKSTNLMLAGGIFANVKVNYTLKSLKYIKKVFVQPQMNDGGLCIGAAALCLHKKKIRVKPLKDVFLGPSADIKKVIILKKKFKKIQIKKYNHIFDQMCNDLSNNKVLGLIRGKMEFGPRALGNRSIIYKTSDKSINDWLNKRMKRTEFMPFAPIIRNENAKIAFKDYRQNDPTFYFMTSTIKCKKIFIDKCPAVTHVDNTARPQVVYKKKDFFLWNLLNKWEKKSGELSLVNTSFNSHGEPIICSEKEAIIALKNKMIDVLYLDKHRITLN